MKTILTKQDSNQLGLIGCDLIGEYDNGNTHVKIYSDGTKVRSYSGNKPISEFPESIDVNVSYRCDNGCEFCYQNCTPNGLVADYEAFDDWLDSIHPFTELAINCNDPYDVQFERFLEKCRQRRIIANITINQNHFLNARKTVLNWIDSRLVYGVGVSVQNVNKTILDAIKPISNAVVHTIVGVTSPMDYYKLFDQELNVLILGYKTIGRGNKYITVHDQTVESNKDWLYRNVDRFATRFKIVSFDNLACQQLNVKRFIKNWDQFYMGDDGTHTMYVDLVKKKYYVSSTESKTNGKQMTNDIVEMFNSVKQ